MNPYFYASGEYFHNYQMHHLSSKNRRSKKKKKRIEDLLEKS